MTFEEFDVFSAALLKEVEQMRDTKGREYAGDGDRFDNFNRLSNKMGISRETVLNVYLTKHMDAIDSYVRNNKEFSTEGIRGRIIDAITYLTLLAGMIEETKPSKFPNMLTGTIRDLGPGIEFKIHTARTCEGAFQYCSLCGALIWTAPPESDNSPAEPFNAGCSVYRPDACYPYRHWNGIGLSKPCTVLHSGYDKDRDNPFKAKV